MTAERVLGDLLCFDLYSVSRAITGRYRTVLEPAGLTYPQYLVLVTLSRMGPTTIGDIGRATRLDHGTLTPLLRRLAGRDLLSLERSSSDARTVTVSLTSAGEAMRPVLADAECYIRESLGLSPAELSALQDTLHRLADRLDTTGA